MKIRRLKKIIIGDIDWKIKWDKKTSGGEFSFKKKEMEIGTKLGEIRMLGILIHELKEIIQCEQCTRYERSDEWDNWEFHYTHKEHTQMCAQLAGLLSQFII